MEISRHLKNTTNYLFEHCSKDIGSMIIWTTIIGWIASSSAQILGIYRNSKYTDKQKSVSQVEVIEDGNFAVYKVTDKESWIVFKIEKGFSLGNFFNMSKAQVVDEYSSEADAIAKMNQLAEEK